MVKKGYYGNEGLSLAWDYFFRHTKFLIQKGEHFFKKKKKKKIENFSLKGIIEM